MENKISTKKILHYKDYKKKIATNQSEKTEPVTKHKILIKNKLMFLMKRSINGVNSQSKTKCLRLYEGQI